MRYIGYLKKSPSESQYEFRKKARKHQKYLKVMFNGIDIKLELEKKKAHYWVGK